MGSLKTWFATAGVLAVSFGLFASGSSAAKTRSGAPVNVSAPTISGTPVVGATLTGAAGAWTGSRLRYAYQWLRCDGTGAHCGPINSATATSYSLTSSDLGSTLRFSVIASSRSGSTSGTSAASSVVTQPTSTSSSPSTPTGLAASGATTTSVTLSWNASTGTDPAAGYDVYMNQTSVATPAGTSFTADSLTCGKTYTFAVDAFDAAGNKSGQASTTASTSACPPSNSSSHIYWGAWIEGKQTYSYLYGGTWTNVPWSTQTWAKYEQNVGKNPSIIHWGAGTFWDHPFSYWAGTMNLAQNAGALNLIDVDTASVSLASIANGSEDAAITSWAQQAKAYGHPFFLRLDWEMNGGWFPWGTTSSTQNSPADYVAAWRHIHDIFSSQGATNVTWVWCPNTAYSGSVPYSQLYPGDAYVDWTCLDGYNMGGSSQSFSSIFSQSYNDLLNVAPTKPVMLGEVASLEYGAGVKANWISDMLNQLPTNFPQIKAMVWFNWRNDHNGTWESNEVESSPSSQSAFANGIASPYYTSASNFTMPAPLTKIQPPS